MAKWAALFFILSVLILPGFSHANNFQTPEISQTSQTSVNPAKSMRIIINLPSRTLELYDDNILVKEYPVAIGKPSTPTPRGSFSIDDKAVNPWWCPPGTDYVVPSGPDNPLGYRWLEFAPLYGIHGTNDPRSIGTPSSNGCVRMHEEDVEELFELVDYETPVEVTYERIKIRLDNHGRASIGIYPDVYGQESVSLAQVKRLLIDKGLGGLVEDEFLARLIQREEGRQIEFAQLHNLKINDQLRPEKIVTWQGVRYAPVQAICEAVNTGVIWDEKSKMLKRYGKIAPGLRKNGILYAAVDDLPTLFPGKELWNYTENCLELRLSVARLDDKIITAEIQEIDGEKAVPAQELADALGEKVKWDEGTKQVLLRNKPIPCNLVESKAFVKISHVGGVFNISAVWNEAAQTLSLSYPLYPVDYSMYLDLMGEFF
ncbi:MAG TPA: L,D-transpeptidase family protein [Methylomusa anaerophila]|uniref:Putative L,D-transpeptidase YkuD n=1 Tax=Methylomusa anaerophila TaxID=1930071 RepID=A0A348AJD5_9FIRM|nr:L,D-transpeptidase family protein [Methylomusa anaerophila]BBB91183.1 putative L,D-transpeptidase YkuD [Methylomusa anaerophila]HML89060.1 L,D-transpeptidase family protein [Methylomusa anaerophila]